MQVLRSNAFLWTLQILLALLFAFAGASKFVMDPAQMAPPGSPVSANFLRFIGTCECLGAIGLIVPQLTGILPRLTPIVSGLELARSTRSFTSVPAGPLSNCFAS